MDTKDSMFVLAIVGIVSIVGVIVLITGTMASSADIAGQAARAKTIDTTTTNFINANSCNADNTCEMDIGSANILTSMHAVFGTPDANNVFDIVFGPDTAAFDVITNFHKAVTFNEGAAFNNGATVHGTTTTNTIKSDDANLGYNLATGYSTLLVTKTGATFNTPAVFNAQTAFLHNVAISQMVGDGNAYVCANSIGQLYRSQTPCTDTASSNPSLDPTQCTRPDPVLVENQMQIHCSEGYVVYSISTTCGIGANPRRVNWAYYEGQPNIIESYTCISDNGVSYLPQGVDGICCKIDGLNQNAPKVLHTVTVNEKGDITRT